MIPSTWFRRVLLALFVLEVGGALMWLATTLVPNHKDQAFAQTVAGVVFLLGFYSGGPVLAKFLAPIESSNRELQERLRRVANSLPGGRPVFLYDHKDESANTVGILAGQSRIYVTTGLMNSVSDEALKGILAHEDAHVREHHILVTFTYACSYAFISHAVHSNKLFVFGFAAFLALRRYLEYRADAGGANRVGGEVMVKALTELHGIYPTKWWSRWFVFGAPYPTMGMRIEAVKTGRRPML